MQTQATITIMTVLPAAIVTATSAMIGKMVRTTGPGHPEPGRPGMVPPGLLLRGIVPPGQLLTGMVPRGQLPRGTVAQGQLLPGTVPQGQLPRGTDPQGQLPRGTVPQGLLPEVLHRVGLRHLVPLLRTEAQGGHPHPQALLSHPGPEQQALSGLQSLMA